jgi:AraC-like DNA-binding protein
VKIVEFRRPPHQKNDSPDSTEGDTCVRRNKFTFQYDDIRDLGNAVGWDLGFRQLSDGEQALDCQVFAGRNVTVLLVRFNRAFHQLGYVPPGTITVGIPLQNVRGWFGESGENGCILPFNQESGFDCVSGEVFAGWTISIDEDFVRDVAEAHQLPVHERLYRPWSRSMIGRSAAFESVRDMLSTYSDSRLTLFGPEQEEELVVGLLRAAMTDSDTADRSAAAMRTHAITTAIDYISSHEGERVTIREICDDTNVAVRTLERAFKDHFGIGPKAYLIRRRLNGVRDVLIRNDGPISIADVANEWGFWHMGQFAKDYRTLFGELPSETLGRVDPLLI